MKWMNTQDTAAHLGITAAELMRSRHRGLPPGILGVVVDGELVWPADQLLPPPQPRRYICDVCGKPYKTANGFNNHISKAHG